MSTLLRTFDGSNLFTLRGHNAVVGRGSFGTVIICKNVSSETFAVKCFALHGSVKEMNKIEERFAAETVLLRKIAHPNILKIYGTVCWKNNLGLVMEYLPRGNLSDLLKQHDLTHIPWSLRLQMALQISKAIVFLHNYKRNKSFIHGDLKPANVLLSDYLDVKLSDFGAINMAIGTGGSSTETKLPPSHQYTLYYIAPEYMKDISLKPSTKQDIYSFGVLLYELITRRRPYENITTLHTVILQAILDREQRPDQTCLENIQSELDPNDLQIFQLLVELMRKCWSQNVRERPEMQTVCDNLDQKFQKIDGKSLREQVITLVKKLDKNVVDFDISKGMSLSLWSPDLDEVPDEKSQIATSKSISESTSEERASAFMTCHLHASTVDNLNLISNESEMNTGTFQGCLIYYSPDDFYTNCGEAKAINQGSFTEVRICKNSGKAFVVKSILISGSRKEIQEKEKIFTEEAQFFCKLSHQHLVKIFGITKYNDHLGLVLECTHCCSLDEFLHSKRKTKQYWDIRLRMASQLSEAICYLHYYKKNISVIHGEIRPENVLLDDKLVVKLSDYFSASLVSSFGGSTSQSVSNQRLLYFTAPELLKDDCEPWTLNIDVYSFGMVLYELVTETRIFDNFAKSVDFVVEVIIKAGQTPDTRPLSNIESQIEITDLHIFNLLKDLMKECWSQNPNDRPNMLKVCSLLKKPLSFEIEETVDKLAQEIAATLHLQKEEFNIKQLTPLNSLHRPSKINEITKLPTPFSTTCLHKGSRIQQIIGRHGGRIEFVDYKHCYVDIPSGALNDDVMIDISVVNLAEDETLDEFILTPTMECLPPNTTFQKPVTISLPTCYVPDNPEVLIIPQTHNGTKWDDMEPTRHGGKNFICFTTDTFSKKRAKAKEDFQNRFNYKFKMLQYVCYQNPNLQKPCLLWRIQEDIYNFNQLLQEGQAFKRNLEIKGNVILEVSIECENPAVTIKPGSRNVSIDFKTRCFMWEDNFFIFGQKNKNLYTEHYSYCIKDDTNVIQSGDFPLPSTKKNNPENVSHLIYGNIIKNSPLFNKNVKTSKRRVIEAKEENEQDDAWYYRYCSII